MTFALPPFDKPETLGDHLHNLCLKLDASFERDLVGDQVRLCLLFRSGDKVCAQGETTMKAYGHLKAKLIAMGIIT